MATRADRIVELLVIISNKSGRIKKLKLECGKQATQICVLNLRIKELEEAIKNVCDLINNEGKVNKWKISNRLEQARKGK